MVARWSVLLFSANSYASTSLSILTELAQDHHVRAAVVTDDECCSNIYLTKPDSTKASRLLKQEQSARKSPDCFSKQDITVTQGNASKEIMHTRKIFFICAVQPATASKWYAKL